MSVTINGSDGITTPSLEVDSTTLVVDEVNNNVGIGTSSPASKLEVEYTDSSRNAVLTLGNLNTGGYGPWVDFNGAYNSGYTMARIGAENESTGSTLRFHTANTSGTSVEAMRLDNAANLKFNSGYGSVATAYGVRAWVNFNGTGTVEILNSGNVSSITDNGTGKYTVNFATAFSDDAYSALVSVAKSDPNDDGNQKATLGNTTRGRSTTTLPVTTVVNTSSLVDTFLICVAVIR